MNAQTPQIQIFQSQQEEDEIHLKDYWAVFKRRWWLILLAFVIVVGLTTVYLIRTPRQYEATAVVRILASGGGGGLAAALGAFLPIGLTSDVATEIETIKGRDIAEKVIGDLELHKKEKNLELDWRQIVSGFQGMLKVGQKGRTNLIEITATSGSPEEAKDIANQTAVEYIQLSETSSQKVWNDLINQMETKLEQTRADLEISRQSLHDYEAKEGITTAFSPLLIGAGASTGGYGTQYVVPEIPQAVATLKASIMKMEVQLEVLRKNFPEADPEVINFKNQIAASRQKLQQEERKAIEKYNKQFGLTRVAAEVVFSQRLYSMLVSKQEELKAQYIMQNKSPEVIERAIEPLYPSKPKRKLILMLGGVLGVFLGLGAALFREFLDSSIHTAQDVTSLLGLPVLGSIPYLRDVRKNQGKDALISYYKANSSRNQRVGEFYKQSYRMLQLEVMAAVKRGHEDTETRQLAASQNSGGLTLLVASSVSGEGKSIVAANLAISMAQTGKKVLLVDANCRNPIQHKLMDLDAGIGLMDMLAGDVTLADVIKNTAIDNLHVIVNGKNLCRPVNSGRDGEPTSAGEDSQTDPSVLFISSRLEDFIKLAKKEFDVIIFDSPPAMLVSEPSAIGSKVDGIVLVAKANDTKKDIILQAKQRMQNPGGNVLGAVLNCAVS